MHVGLHDLRAPAPPALVNRPQMALSLVLRCEGDHGLVKIAPSFVEVRIHMLQDVHKALIELGLYLRISVEAIHLIELGHAPAAVVRQAVSGHVCILPETAQGVAIMERNVQLDSPPAGLDHEVIHHAQDAVIVVGAEAVGLNVIHRLGAALLVVCLRGDDEDTQDALPRSPHGIQVSCATSRTFRGQSVREEGVDASPVGTSLCTSNAEHKAG
mmetsp:Transcript_19846/g.46393  ORF Transcript_19846/g.46393 Transcript_19846/m.46393 type:complete len:214 (+) Transcript_19846:861-1502(+)